MSDKNFGVKQINIIGGSGTPTISSPNVLNLNSPTVAISTNLSIGGDVSVSGVSTFNGGIVNTGGLLIESDNEIELKKKGTNDTLALFTPDSSVELYYDGSKKFETFSAGVTVTGTTFTNQLSVSGVSTFGNLQIGISTVYSVSDVLGNIGIGTNETINEYINGNSILSIHGRTAQNPLVAGSGVIRIYSNETLLGQIYGQDLTGLGFGKTFIIDSSVPMGISCGSTITMSGTTEIQQLKVTGISTFTGSTVVGIDTSTGVVLTSPNGTQYQLFVENDGTLKTVAI